MDTSTLTSQFDKPPPHSTSSEVCALASMMLAGDDAALFYETKALLSREAFFTDDHAIIFTALCELRDRAGKVDGVLLREELLRRQLLDEVGGSAYLAEILNSVPSANHGPYYAGIVRDRYRKRQLITAANELIRTAYAPSDVDNGEDLCQQAAARFAGICTDSDRGPGVFTLADVMNDVHEQLDKGDRPCVLTGFRDLDARTGGIQRGEMVVVGARPSMGKSTWGKQTALRVAKAGTPVGIISNEEGRFKIGRNLLSSVAEIDNHRLRDGKKLEKDDWRKISNATAVLSPLPILIREKASNIRTVRAAAAYMVAKGCRLIIVDYLQRIGGGRGESRYAQVSDVSLQLSDLFKELDVAGLVLAQLNRGTERRDDHRPTMTDLRDSGQIEQDADGIVFLHREDYYRTTDPARSNEGLDGKAELIIAKWRDGVRGVKPVILRSNLAYQRFEDWEEDGPFSR